ncbi:elongation factor 1-gamma (EF-1-gamma), putative [Trypanosoma cruzi]|uniref:Elongation factor 1-gamma (EF-1-gamma), putative n=1 Tax=Trypanosoma cruzi (strain CL Brener) TaxID=353153 RepID=Q4DEZ5_TRYCC|nr:elongation factor 1-gamma (EF-1-gamma), putative [Trypanosoma cruzi]EAN91101.1 elongation factor 1-gamma (EF-1-gamma), putative [Trypanosoma cruzi]|eukprot:XP_812952.1 elongation factor 1-gamma (EF-1-gamma) [Trypanosoma cruzi strain CL Brener]
MASSGDDSRCAPGTHPHTIPCVSLRELDELKIDYSHTDTRTVAAPYFFQHCDAAGCTTLWYNKYNKMQCMTANLIRVWLQRMEHVGQYALGAALMFVEQRRHDIVALCVLGGRACRRF